jgi:sugar phosphate permease
VTVYRKITRRLLPLLFLAYSFAFLDRINVGYAHLQMKTDLGFSDATYGLGAGIFAATLFTLAKRATRVGAAV